MAIIGGGPAGMNVAWQLALAGVEAHIFEKDEQIGGKLAQVIPWERLSQAIWDQEIKRFLATPNIKVEPQCRHGQGEIRPICSRITITWSSPSAPTRRGVLPSPAMNGWSPPSIF